MSYAVSLAGETWLVLRRQSSMARVVVLAFTLAGFLAHTAYLITRSQTAGLPPLLSSQQDWLLVLAWVCTVGAYMGYLDALRRVSVFTVNVIYNLEPVYGIVLALVFFGEAEKMSAGFYLGAAVIVGVVLALPWVRRKQGAVPVPPS
jgi:drug/metabolite transporter (DMT)-like permease